MLAVCLIRWIVHYKAPTNKHLVIHHTVHHRAMVTEALVQLRAAAEAIDTEVRFRRPRVAARASSCAFLSRSRRRSASASAACDAAVSSASASSSAPTSTRPLHSSSSAQRRSRAAVRSIFSRSSCVLFDEESFVLEPECAAKFEVGFSTSAFIASAFCARPGSRPSLCRVLNEEFFCKKFGKKLRGPKVELTVQVQFKLRLYIVVRAHPEVEVRSEGSVRARTGAATGRKSRNLGGGLERPPLVRNGLLSPAPTPSPGCRRRRSPPHPRRR